MPEPTTPPLSNPRSDRVKAVRALAGRPARSRAGRYLVEGPQGVREVVRHAPDRVVEVYLTPEAGARHPEIAEAIGLAGTRVQPTTPEVMAVLSADAQGVLAVVRSAPEDLDAALERPVRLVAVLATVRDPGNAGTVIRVADAAGADAVVLTAGSVDVLNPKVVRSTAGSLFHLPVVHGLEVADTVAALRRRGLRILAADGAGSHDLDDLQDLAARGRVTDGATAGSSPGETAPDLSAPTAWVFGNEAWGLPPEVRDLADAVVRVPIRGLAESLNLATAAAVCLYASARAHRQPPPPAGGGTH